MKKKKQALRIGTLLTILLFLLIPLLSSPVAATLSFEPASGVNSSADGTSVQAFGYQASDGSVFDDSSGTVIFTCDYYFEDTDTTGTSLHEIEMRVWKKSNPGNVKTDSDVKVLCNSNFEDTLVVTDTYTPPELPCTWQIDILIEVTDNAVTPSYDSWTVNPVVEFEVK